MQSSSPTALSRQRSIHDILGGGAAADVILWRRRDAAMGALAGTLAALLVFEVSGYTLLSLVSSVLLLLISVLFLWAKAAAVLRRPLPAIPKMYISEEAMNEVADSLRTYINRLLSSFRDIALGKDAKLYYEVAGCLWMLAFFGSLMNLLTFGYTTILIILTIPALYEKYEDWFEQHLKFAQVELQMHIRECSTCLSKYFNRLIRWLIDKKNLL